MGFPDTFTRHDATNSHRNVLTVVAPIESVTELSASETAIGNDSETSEINRTRFRYSGPTPTELWTRFLIWL